MPSWNDLGTAFNTLRELDVTAIREESERPLTIFCLGPRHLYTAVVEMLRPQGSRRYGPAGRDPFVHQPLPPGEPGDELRRADLLLVLLDGREPVATSTSEALSRLSNLVLPTVILICGRAAPGDLGEPRPQFAHAHIAVLPDPGAPEALDHLASAIFERLPAELHLAAARAVPGLRPAYAHELVSSVSFTNASYALASALPQQIPILAVPFATADLVVLTKNQSLMVYRLALAYGAPPEFQARMAEITPVIGGAFAWRQLARTLVGLIPVWGVVPKVAVSYAGTYTTGIAALRWFADGEVLPRERLKVIAEEAMRVGRERATALVAAAREQSTRAGQRLKLPWAGKGKPSPGDKPAPKQ